MNFINCKKHNVKATTFITKTVLCIFVEVTWLYILSGNCICSRLKKSVFHTQPYSFDSIIFEGCKVKHHLFQAWEEDSLEGNIFKQFSYKTSKCDNPKQMFQYNQCIYKKKLVVLMGLRQEHITLKLSESHTDNFYNTLTTKNIILGALTCPN